MAIRLLNQNAEVLNKSAAVNMNISASKRLQDVLKTNLGPKDTIKMLVGGAGDIKLTKDGNTLLKEMGVSVALPITEGVMVDTATPRSAQEKVMITPPPCTTQGVFQERSSVPCAQGIAVPPAQRSTPAIIDILDESGDNLFSHYEIPGLDASTPAKSPAGLEHIIRELTMSPPSVPGPCSDKWLQWGLHPEAPSASSDDLELLPAQFEETELNANRHAGLANVPSLRDLLRGVRVKRLSLELLKQVKLSKPSTFLGMSALSIRDREAVLEELSCLLDMLAQKPPLDTRESDIMLLESSFDRLLRLGDGHLDLRWLDARIIKIKNSRLLQAKSVAYDKQLAQYSLLQEAAAQAVAKCKQAEVALRGMAAEIAALEGESLALEGEDSFAKDLLT